MFVCTVFYYTTHFFIFFVSSNTSSQQPTTGGVEDPAPAPVDVVRRRPQQEGGLPQDAVGNSQRGNGSCLCLFACLCVREFAGSCVYLFVWVHVFACFCVKWFVCLFYVNVFVYVVGVFACLCVLVFIRSYFFKILLKKI